MWWKCQMSLLEDLWLDCGASHLFFYFIYCVWLFAVIWAAVSAHRRDYGGASESRSRSFSVSLHCYFDFQKADWTDEGCHKPLVSFLWLCFKDCPQRGLILKRDDVPLVCLPTSLCCLKPPSGSQRHKKSWIHVSHYNKKNLLTPVGCVWHFLLPRCSLTSPSSERLHIWETS